MNSKKNTDLIILYSYRLNLLFEMIDMFYNTKKRDPNSFYLNEIENTISGLLFSLGLNKIDFLNQKKKSGLIKIFKGFEITFSKIVNKNKNNLGKNEELKQTINEFIINIEDNIKDENLLRIIKNSQFVLELASFSK